MSLQFTIGGVVECEVEIVPGSHVYWLFNAPDGYSVRLSAIYVGTHPLRRDGCGMFHGDGGLLVEEHIQPRGIFVYPPILSSFRLLCLFEVLQAWQGNPDERKRALVAALRRKRKNIWLSHAPWSRGKRMPWA